MPVSGIVAAMSGSVSHDSWDIEGRLLGVAHGVAISARGEDPRPA